MISFQYLHRKTVLKLETKREGSKTMWPPSIRRGRANTGLISVALTNVKWRHPTPRRNGHSWETNVQADFTPCSSRSRPASGRILGRQKTASTWNKASQMSTRSCSLRWTWPPHKEHAEWSAAGVWGARLMCWMLVSVPARRRGHLGQSRKGGGQEAPPGAIICWDWQAGCPSCECVFSFSSWYGYTGGVLGCPQGVAHLHCPQSCSCRLGCGCESLSWPASCHCAAEEIKRNSTMKSGLGTGDPTAMGDLPNPAPMSSASGQWA